MQVVRALAYALTTQSYVAMDTVKLKKCRVQRRDTSGGVLTLASMVHHYRFPGPTQPCHLDHISFRPGAPHPLHRMHLRQPSMSPLPWDMCMFFLYCNMICSSSCWLCLIRHMSINQRRSCESNSAGVDVQLNGAEVPILPVTLLQFVISHQLPQSSRD